jgi:hypothetical protein
MTRLTPTAAALALAACLSGCSDPYTNGAPTRPASSSSLTPSGELPGRIPPREREALALPGGRPAPSAQAAVRRHAELVTNWTSATVAGRYRQAAALAVGQARQDAQQTAASAESDAQLASGGTTSRAVTVAIVAQPHGWVLVVTREEFTPAAGPARYRVYRAHTRAVDGGIAVDEWRPEP